MKATLFPPLSTPHLGRCLKGKETKGTTGKAAKLGRRRDDRRRGGRGLRVSKPLEGRLRADSNRWGRTGSSSPKGRVPSPPSQVQACRPLPSLQAVSRTNAMEEMQREVTWLAKSHSKDRPSTNTPSAPAITALNAFRPLKSIHYLVLHPGRVHKASETAGCFALAPLPLVTSSLCLIPMPPYHTCK